MYNIYYIYNIYVYVYIERYYNGLFWKNPDSWGKGVDDMEFPRVLKRYYLKIPRVN